VSIDQGIWHCTFSPKSGCKDKGKGKGKKVHQLGAGEYDDLFGEGGDFVSFMCLFYPSGGVEQTVLIPEDRQVALSPSRHLQGQVQKFDITEKTCYNLPDVIVRAVKSMIIGYGVWHCAFFPKSDCKGTWPIHRLDSGEYRDLMGDGDGFVSFWCECRVDCSEEE